MKIFNLVFLILGFSFDVAAEEFAVTFLGEEWVVTADVNKSVKEWVLEDVRIRQASERNWNYIETEGGWGIRPLDELCVSITNSQLNYAATLKRGVASDFFFKKDVVVVNAQTGGRAGSYRFTKSDKISVYYKSISCTLTEIETGGE